MSSTATSLDRFLIPENQWAFRGLLQIGDTKRQIRDSLRRVLSLGAESEAARTVTVIHSFTFDPALGAVVPGEPASKCESKTFICLDSDAAISRFLIPGDWTKDSPKVVLDFESDEHVAMLPLRKTTHKALITRTIRAIPRPILE